MTDETIDREKPAVKPLGLDPEAGTVWRGLSEALFEGGGPVVGAETLEAVRSFELTTRDTLLEDRPFSEEKLSIPGPDGELGMSVFTPEEHKPLSPAIVWIHGGGMISGTRYLSSEALDTAVAADAVVASIEYRLAPDHPAPAPLQDCYAALTWFMDNAADFGVDSERVVLAGASAGGGLAAATAMWARDNEGPPLAGLMLCCPMLDDRMGSVSAHQFGEDLLWSRESNTFGWASLLGARAGGPDVTVYEAPGRATEVWGLPPTLIDVGSADIFRDEDVAFASAIWAAGGDAELHVWPGGYHGFEILAPEAIISRDASEARRRWFTRTLARSAG